MLQRDYLAKVIESFTKRTSETLRDAVVLRSAEGVSETEDALGVQLLIRDGAHGSELTPEGKQLLDTYDAMSEKLSQEAVKLYEKLSK